MPMGPCRKCYSRVYSRINRIVGRQQGQPLSQEQLQTALYARLRNAPDAPVPAPALPMGAAAAARLAGGAAAAESAAVHGVSAAHGNTAAAWGGRQGSLTAAVNAAVTAAASAAASAASAAAAAAAGVQQGARGAPPQQQEAGAVDLIAKIKLQGLKRKQQTESQTLVQAQRQAQGHSQLLGRSAGSVQGQGATAVGAMGGLVQCTEPVVQAVEHSRRHTRASAADAPLPLPPAPAARPVAPHIRSPATRVGAPAAAVHVTNASTHGNTSTHDSYIHAPNSSSHANVLQQMDQLAAAVHAAGGQLPGSRAQQLLEALRNCLADGAAGSADGAAGSGGGAIPAIAGSAGAGSNALPAACACACAGGIRGADDAGQLQQGLGLHAEGGGIGSSTAAAGTAELAAAGHEMDVKMGQLPPCSISAPHAAAVPTISTSAAQQLAGTLSPSTGCKTMSGDAGAHARSSAAAGAGAALRTECKKERGLADASRPGFDRDVHRRCRDGADAGGSGGGGGGCDNGGGSVPECAGAEALPAAKRVKTEQQ